MKNLTKVTNIFVATIFVSMLVTSSGCGWWSGLWGSGSKPKPTANTTDAIPEKKAPPNQKEGNTKEPLPGEQPPPPVPPEGEAPGNNMTGSLSEDRDAGLAPPRGESPLLTGATTPPPKNIYDPPPRPSNSELSAEYSPAATGAKLPRSNDLAPPPPNIVDQEPPPPPPPPAPVKTAQAAPSGAKALFQKRCSKCHELEKPLSLKLTRNNWATLVDSMKLKMFSGISDEEADIITDYLAQTRGK